MLKSYEAFYDGNELTWLNQAPPKLEKKVRVVLVIEEEPPVEIQKAKYNLADLVAQMPNDYKPQEENWGSPVGKEVW
jgi:antitoxin component of MazEF toxin-antitoxin module